MKKIITLVGLTILAGCASSGPVPMGKDTYMITKQAASHEWSSSSDMKADILREANAHCSSMGKQMQLVATHEQPAGISRPSAEIDYMCLSANDPSLQRPVMKTEPNVVVEMRTQ